jgi:hypothetical protein
MGAHARHTAPPVPPPLDVSPRPISIRSLDYRRASDLIARVRGEFVEMRGFSPTAEQAARLFAIPADECLRILTTLVHDGFLRCTPDGRYRLSAG